MLLQMHYPDLEMHQPGNLQAGAALNDTDSRLYVLDSAATTWDDFHETRLPVTGGAMTALNTGSAANAIVRDDATPPRVLDDTPCDLPRDIATSS